MKTSIKHNGMALKCMVRNMAPIEITHKFEGITEELINGEGREFADRVGYEMPLYDINRMISSWIKGIFYVLEMFPGINKESTAKVKEELDAHREKEFKKAKKKLEKAFSKSEVQKGE